MIQQKLPGPFLYLLSFIEGGAVMAVELIGAKMLAPFFGSSLYVWATVLAITLGGLALGYLTGGRISYTTKNKNMLFYVLLAASTLIMVMPYSSVLVMQLLGHHALLPAIVTCTFLFLFPPVFMMGMVSPLIINAITTDAALAGRIAGNVYAVSTLGGIIATFLTGFYIIPNFGLRLPCIIIGSLMGILPLLVIIRNNKLLAFLFIVITTFLYYNTNYNTPTGGLTVKYRADGLLGQVMVIDWPVFNLKKKTKHYDRFLFVNRITQTRLSLSADSIKGFEYINTICNALVPLPKGSRILLMGLGGGSMANELVQMGFNLDVCELDARIYKVARDYFNLNTTANYYIDDARHFIRTAGNKYDVLILDVFRGEENPAHCFTVEAFNDMKQVLGKEGILIINGNGYIKGERGKGMRSVQKTIAAAGYSVSLVSTQVNEDQSNLVFFAALSDSKSKQFQTLPANHIVLTPAELADAFVLEDNRPMLDKLNLAAYRTWRTTSIQYFNNAAKNGLTAPYF